VAAAPAVVEVRPAEALDEQGVWPVALAGRSAVVGGVAWSDRTCLAARVRALALAGASAQEASVEESLCREPPPLPLDRASPDHRADHDPRTVAGLPVARSRDRHRPAHPQSPRDT